MYGHIRNRAGLVVGDGFPVAGVVFDGPFETLCHRVVDFPSRHAVGLGALERMYISEDL